MSTLNDLGSCNSKASLVEFDVIIFSESELFEALHEGFGFAAL